MSWGGQMVVWALADGGGLSLTHAQVLGQESAPSPGYQIKGSALATRKGLSPGY